MQQTQQTQQFNPYGSYNPYVKEDRYGQKCPDGICDEFERANAYACPVDCGGQVEQRQPIERYDEPPRQEYNQQQSPQEQYQQPENRIDQPQQPYQQPPIASTEQSPITSGGESAPAPASSDTSGSSKLQVVSSSHVLLLYA